MKRLHGWWKSPEKKEMLVSILEVVQIVEGKQLKQTPWRLDVSKPHKVWRMKNDTMRDEILDSQIYNFNLVHQLKLRQSDDGCGVVKGNV